MQSTDVKPADLSYIFDAAVEMMEVFSFIPIDDIREIEMEVLQELSKHCGYKHVQIYFDVRWNGKQLSAKWIRPLDKNRFNDTDLMALSNQSSVIIGNDVTPEVVCKELFKLSKRYHKLTKSASFKSQFIINSSTALDTEDWIDDPNHKMMMHANNLHTVFIETQNSASANS